MRLQWRVKTRRRRVAFPRLRGNNNATRLSGEGWCERVGWVGPELQGGPPRRIQLAGGSQQYNFSSVLKPSQMLFSSVAANGDAIVSVRVLKLSLGLLHVHAEGDLERLTLGNSDKVELRRPGIGYQHRSSFVVYLKHLA